MAGTPMKRRVLAALQARATRECGENSTIVDYACSVVAAGHCMRHLADLVASDLGHPVSRSFVSWTLNNVAPDAKTRLQTARREARLTTQSTIRAIKTASGDERQRSADDRALDIIAA